MRDGSPLRKRGRSGKFARILTAVLALCACGASSYRHDAFAQTVSPGQIDGDLTEVEPQVEEDFGGARPNMFVDVDVDAVDDLIIQL